MTEHTPTPYTVKPLKDGRAHLQAPSGGYLAIVFRPEDAEFITRATNNYVQLIESCNEYENLWKARSAHIEALVEALTETVHTLIELARLVDPNHDPSGVENGPTVTKARAVLDKITTGGGT